MRSHAKLSASSSHRWILCPGSVNAEEGLPDVKSKYAEEGIFAHEVAAKILNHEDISDLDISAEIQENVYFYLDYVKQISYSNQESKLFVEKTVYYPNIAPENFGTADAIIRHHNHLHILDFKYGVNKVEAYKNSQLLLYALGEFNEITNKKFIENITLHVIQPRINHFDKWTLSVKELSFYEGYLKAKAEEALRDDAPRRPHEIACKWCKARFNCPALLKFTNVVEEQINNNLTDLQVKHIMDNSKLIKSFLDNIESTIFNRLYSGESFPGYKLVKGKSIRKIKPESYNKLFEMLGEKAYIKSPIGVMALEKLLDKETLNDLIYISTPKPVLVNNEDKRKSFISNELDFDPVKEGLS